MSREAVVAFVGLGANLGDAAACVITAMSDLDRLVGTRVTCRSRLYRSAPYQASGPDFINAVVEISTRLSAPDLLVALQQLELTAGRVRPYPNAPRTLDLDLLLYGSACVVSSQLTLPHPRMMERAFVLIPLAEIAPDRVDAAHLAAIHGQDISVFHDLGS